MVTLQILVLSFQVRILVAQQEKSSLYGLLFFLLVIHIFIFPPLCPLPLEKGGAFFFDAKHHLAVFSQRHNGPQERACGEKRLASIARPILSPPFGKPQWFPLSAPARHSVQAPLCPRLLAALKKGGAFSLTQNITLLFFRSVITGHRKGLAE